MTSARKGNNDDKTLMVNRESKDDESAWTKQHARREITSYTQGNSNDVVRTTLSQITLSQPLTYGINVHALHEPMHNCGRKTK